MRGPNLYTVDDISTSYGKINRPYRFPIQITQYVIKTSRVIRGRKLFKSVCRFWDKLAKTVLPLKPLSFFGNLFCGIQRAWGKTNTWGIRKSKQTNNSWIRKSNSWGMSCKSIELLVLRSWNYSRNNFEIRRKSNYERKERRKGFKVVQNCFQHIPGLRFW